MSVAFQKYQGRPSSKRSDKEEAVYDLLESLEISFVRVDHEPTASIQLCEAVEEILEVNICKNLFLCNRQKKDFYLLMMPGRKEFKTRELSAQLGTSRLSFGDPDFMREFLNTEPGSASILGLMNDKENKITLVIDRDVLQDEYIGCHPCENTSSLKIATIDLLEKILPAIGHDFKIVSF